MRLLSCHIENFGKLHQLEIRFDPSLHVTAAENGWGKSTLAAFIRVMFYGFDGEGRRDPVKNERLRYAPWQGGPYGGTLSFTAGGRAYRAERTFGTRRSEDSFLLIDLQTGLASDAFTGDLGRDLFGVDQASFRRTLFIGQRTRQAEPTGDIRARIGRDLPEAGDLAACDRALPLLEKKKKALSPDRAASPIRRGREEAAALKARAASLEGLREREAGQGARVLSLEEDLAGARRDLEALEKAMAEGSLSGPEEGTGDRSRRLEEALAREEEALALLKEQKEAGAGAGKGSPAPPFLAAALVSLAGALVLFFLDQPLLSALCLGAGLSALLPALHGLRREKEQRKASSLEEEILRRDRRALALREKLALLREKPAHAGEDPASLAASFGALSRRILALETSLDRERSRLESLVSMREEAEEAAAAYEKSCRELTSLQQQYKILDKTLAHLSGARDRFQARCAAPFETAFASFYGALSGGEPASFQTDASLSVSVREEGQVREEGLLSEGARDLVALCRRLAMADAMYGGLDRPFLVLDDPFVNLDDDSVRSGLALVRGLARDRQVLYFTCHYSRIP